MNRGNITPSPQSVVSYQNPNTPAPPQPSFPPGSTMQGLACAAGAPGFSYFPVPT